MRNLQFTSDIGILYHFNHRNNIHFPHMDNYLIIDDIDVAFIEQNSWIVLLEKQILRNLYLFKQYSRNREAKPKKINIKNLTFKIKDSICKHITLRIKKRKSSERFSSKLQCKLQNQNSSLTLRRKTQECFKANFDNQISEKISNYTISNKVSNSRQIHLSKNGRYKDIEQKGQLNFLPFQSCSVILNNNQNLLKRSSHKLLQSQIKSPKSFLQAKPISSLNDLEFIRNKKPMAQSNLQKRLNHTEKLLVRSSMNSPTKNLKQSKQYSGLKMEKRSSAEFPQIQKNSSKKLTSSKHFENHMKLFGCQMTQKSVSFHKKSQQTKESDSENIYELESIIQVCMRVQKSQKQESFQDNHIGKNGLKNYRISKIRNIKFPLYQEITQIIPKNK